MNYTDSKKLKVEDVISMLSMQSSQERCNTVLFIIDKIFNKDDNYWNFMSNIKSKEDGDKILNLLSPSGQLMQAILSLIVSGKAPSIHEFPVSKLSNLTETLINENKIPEFFKSKLFAKHNHANFPQNKVLYLNVFEYFIFHFTSYPVNCQMKSNKNRCFNSVNNSSVSGLVDTIYYQLLNKYLDFFFFRIPESAGLIQATLHSRNTHQHHRLSFEMNYTPHQTGYPDISTMFYYTNSFIFTLMEFWMNVFFDSPVQILGSSNLNPPTDILPCLPIICFVRMFLKHFYHFCYCKSLKVLTPNTQIECEYIQHLNNYRRDVISPIIISKLSHFLLKLFKCWPADLTFKMVLETWLSLIQPWRYKDSPHHNDEAVSNHPVQNSYNPVPNELCERPWIERYAKEIYQDILPCLAQRLLRTDFGVLRNTQMLYRIAKVFSGIQFKSDFGNLIGENWQEICERMSRVLHEVELKLKTKNCSNDGLEKGWFDKLNDFICMSDLNNDTQKIENYLKFSYEVLAEIFYYDDYKKLYPQSNINTNCNLSFSDDLKLKRPRNTELQDSINRNIKATTSYYQRTATNTEVVWLVGLFSFLSQIIIGNKATRRIRKWSAQPTIIGKLVRYIFFGFGNELSVSQIERIKPHLRLRWLASKKVIFWSGIFWLICQLYNGLWLEAFILFCSLACLVIYEACC